MHLGRGVVVEQCFGCSWAHGGKRRWRRTNPAAASRLGGAGFMWRRREQRRERIHGGDDLQFVEMDGVASC